jgi:hypothetical protein
MGISEDIKALQNRLTLIEEVLAPAFGAIVKKTEQLITDPASRQQALGDIDRMCGLAELVPFGPVAALATKLQGLVKIAEEYTAKELAAQQAARADAQKALEAKLPPPLTVEQILSGS